MAKILLIQPSYEPNQTKASLYAAMPLGLIYISSFLNRHGHSIKILDRNLIPSNEHLKHILKNEYDFVGIGTYTSSMLYDALDVSKIVKQNSGSIVIWGGFHPTIVPEQTLKNPNVDYIIRGEAEKVFLEILEYYEKGKEFSHLKSVNLNPMANPLDIDELPIIDYNLVDYKKYPNFFVSTSRGCPYRCTFCYNSYGFNSVKPYRDLSLEKSIQLIEKIVSEYKVKTFTIVDDNFTSDREKLKKLSEFMKKFDVKFDTFSKANYSDLETLSYLKKAGCWQIQIGVESGSQRILNFIKKGTTIQMNADAIKNCKKIGIMSHCGFMIGIPTETIEELNQTARFINQNKPDLGGAAIFHPYPKTLLWDYCIENKLIKKIPETVEEWADSYPANFSGTKMNVSGIPDEVLLSYQSRLSKMINKGRYFKKTVLYLKNGRLPDYRKVISILKNKTYRK